MESLAKAAAERGETDKLVVRTDFGDDQAWQAVLAAGLQSWGDDGDDEEGFESTTYAVDDPSLAGWSVDQVREAVVVQDADLPVLFIRHASGVHVNLWLANMDFTDWAQTAAASPDGVFHDFD
jgi:hypothetical protein